MATTKITDLTAYTDPLNTDVLPIVDVTSDVTKKVSIANVMKNASLGTAAAPGIAFDGDSNTGIYSPGADQVALSTNGSERLRITSAGLVGIGTSSPSSLLALLHTASTAYSQNTEGLTLRGSSGTVNRFTSLNFDGSGYAGNIANVAGVTTTLGTSYANSAGALRFATKDTTDATPVDRLSITAAGNVGIGTTSPSSILHCSSLDAVLTLQGTRGTGATASIGTGGTNSQNLVITAGTDLYQRGATHLFQNVAGTTEYARIDSSGRLLIGTSSNSGDALLQVNGDRIRVGTAKTPASATDTGTTGEICWDANYIYVCTATNTWKRTAIATW